MYNFVQCSVTIIYTIQHRLDQQTVDIVAPMLFCCIQRQTNSHCSRCSSTSNSRIGLSTSIYDRKHNLLKFTNVFKMEYHIYPSLVRFLLVFAVFRLHWANSLHRYEILVAFCHWIGKMNSDTHKQYFRYSENVFSHPPHLYGHRTTKILLLLLKLM